MSRLGMTVLALLVATGPAAADTLKDALVQTYSTNPTLTGARAQLRQLDEGVAIARAQGRLQVTGTAGLTQSFGGLGTFDSRGRSITAGANVAFPLFQGGRVANGVRAADARVEAGRSDLRGVEADIFTEAVGAYMDVIRDQSIVDLNRNQVKVLETNLQASRDRFEVGDLTRTDVAQSEARLSGARSQLAVAQGNLVGSQENYRRVIGKMPTALAAPPPLPTLPDNPDRAVQIAVENNPQLSAITARGRAAAYDISVARAGRLPTISAVAGQTYNNYLGTLDNAVGTPGANVDQVQTNSNIGLSLSVPLYQGGGVAARIRQAQAVESQVLEQNVLIERSIVARARSSFASYRAAQEAITAQESAVSANTLALEGARAENSVGTRTVIEVLNAEQELLNSQVLLVTARRNLYVAGFALLNAMGQAELRDLNLETSGPLYDPTVNYNRVSRRASDFYTDGRQKPQATRTVGPEEGGPVQPPR